MADGSRITCAHSVALALDIFLMIFFFLAFRVLRLQDCGVWWPEVTRGQVRWVRSARKVSDLWENQI